MTDHAVTTSHLSKTYGRHPALTDLTMHVPTDAVYGFIGANGAGKSTTIRILLGLARATSGSATVLGVERGHLPPTPVRGVSHLPDVPDLNPWLRAPEAVSLFARLAGADPDLAAHRARELLELVGLGRARGRIGGFSRGMRQRLGIAAALAPAPRLLVLDEPTSALDPRGRADVLGVIAALRGRATVLFSSHLLDDVESVSTHVGILHAGHLLAEGPVEALLEADPRATTNLCVRDVPRDRAAQVARRTEAVLAAAGVDSPVEIRTGTLQDLHHHLTERSPS